MGELGWTLERWEKATFTEFNYAIEGYWRNWERFAMVPAREVCFVSIAGNPYIKSSDKPKSSKDFIKLSIDEETKTAERPTEEEILTAQKMAFNGKE